MDVGSAFVAGAESLEGVQPGEAAFHDPADAAEPGAMGLAAAGDAGCDAAGAQQAPVLVVVVAAVGVDLSWLAARPPASAADRRDGVQQRDELRDVVAVPAGEGDGDGDAAGVADQVVLAARTAAVDRGWADVVPPLSART